MRPAAWLAVLACGLAACAQGSALDPDGQDDLGGLGGAGGEPALDAGGDSADAPSDAHDADAHLDASVDHDAAGDSGGSGGNGGAGGAGGTGGSGGAGGAGGTGGSAGAGGTGGSDGGTTCPGGQKKCNGTCVPQTNPLYGCATAGCAPCTAPVGATATCSTTNTCDFACPVGTTKQGSQCVTGNPAGCPASEPLSGDPCNPFAIPAGPCSFGSSVCTCQGIFPVLLWLCF